MPTQHLLLHTGRTVPVPYGPARFTLQHVLLPDAHPPAATPAPTPPAFRLDTYVYTGSRLPASLPAYQVYFLRTFLHCPARTPCHFTRTHTATHLHHTDTRATLPVLRWFARTLNTRHTLLTLPTRLPRWFFRLFNSPPATTSNTPVCTTRLFTLRCYRTYTHRTPRTATHTGYRLVYGAPAVHPPHHHARDVHAHHSTRLALPGHAACTTHATHHTCHRTPAGIPTGIYTGPPGTVPAHSYTCYTHSYHGLPCLPWRCSHHRMFPHHTTTHPPPFGCPNST